MVDSIHHNYKYIRYWL